MTMSANGLTKLVEECGELSQIAAKKIAYMGTDKHPDGKGSMKTRLEDEIADVIASSIFVSQTLDLNQERMEKRIAFKLKTYLDWHTRDDS